MSKTAKQKNILIGVLLVLVLIMVVGYAAFATRLNITGTATTDNTWCVGFDSTKTSDMVPTAGVNGAPTPTGTISFDGDTCASQYKTDASLSANFKQPGDKMVYTLTIANKSTLTAAIKSIKVENESVSSNKTITKGNVKFTIEMPENTTLAADATTTMKVTAQFQNDTDLKSFEGSETQTIDVEINAQQDDGNGGMDITYPFTGTIYRWNTNSLPIGASIQTVTKNVWVIANRSGYQGPPDVYDTEAECQTGYTGYGSPTGYSCQEKEVTTGAGEYTTVASELNKKYYLKHDVIDDVVTASYVCFVSDTEHCMKGGDNGASFSENTQTIKDYQSFYNLTLNINSSSSNPGCYFDSMNSRCYGGGFSQVSAIFNGKVYVSSSSSKGCSVGGEGNSSCTQ